MSMITGHDYLNINSCTSAKNWATTGMPVLGHNEPTPGQYWYPLARKAYMPIYWAYCGTITFAAVMP